MVIMSRKKIRARRIGLMHILLLVLLSNICKNSVAQNAGDWGLVIAGTFVIPSKGLPWTDPEGRSVGKRIGYLEAGTLVKIGDCNHVNGPNKDSTGKYCDVRSEVGTEGKAQINRILILSPGKTYAVARRKKEVLLYRRYDLSKRGGSYSRNSGVLVEIVGDWKNAKEDAGVDVIATYNKYKPNTLIELAALKSDLVKKTNIIEMPTDINEPPEKFEIAMSEEGKESLVGERVALWSFKKVTSDSAEHFASKVYQDLEWTNELSIGADKVVSKVFKVTSNVLDMVLCAAEIKADVSLGWKFLGSGLKIQGKLPIHSDEKLFDFDVNIIEKNGLVRFWVLTAKTVSCHLGSGVFDSHPKAIEKATVFLVKNSLPAGAPVRLIDSEVERYGLRVPEAVDATELPRLFYIRGFLDYANARRFIATTIANSAVMDQLNRQERRVLQHSMIANLAYFQREVPAYDLD